MALKRFIAASLAVMLLAAAASIAAGGGTGADPVATLGYIEKKVIPQFNAKLDAAVSSAEPELAAIRDYQPLACGKAHGDRAFRREHESVIHQAHVRLILYLPVETG